MSRALRDHLATWLGAWPAPGTGLTVVAAGARSRPTWDGAVRPLLGAVGPDGAGAVVVVPALLDDVAELVHGRPVEHLADERTRRAVGELVHGRGAVASLGVLRWVEREGDPVVAALPDLGTWLDHSDPRVPPWLEPFGGEALVALDDDGAHAAGVGVKRHADTGHELAVVTDEQHRGRGLARRLVATAARSELGRVPVVTYHHARDNVGSARVAEAVGFRDRGWRVIGIFGGEAPG